MQQDACQVVDTSLNATKETQNVEIRNLAGGFC